MRLPPARSYKPLRNILHRCAHGGAHGGQQRMAVQQVYDHQGEKRRIFTFDSSSPLPLRSGVAQQQASKDDRAPVASAGRNVLAAATDGFRAYILPKGYPYSVGPGYIDFVGYQMVSVTLSSAGGVLAMQSMLTAIGACHL